MNDEVKTDASGRTINGNFEITGILTDKRQIRLSGYLLSDDSQADIDKRIDMAQAAITRQVMIMDMVNKEAELASFDARVAELGAHFDGLLTKKAKGDKLTSTEKAELSKYEGNVRFLTQQKASNEAAIRAARAKLNGSAPQQ